jgi:hypothetical protein
MSIVVCASYLRANAQDAEPHAVFPPDSGSAGTDQTILGPPVFLNVNLSGNPAPQNEPTVRISRADNNLVVAAWRDFQLGYTNPIIRRIGYTYSTDGGKTWAPSQLLPDPGPTYVSQSDPVLTSDLAGNFYLSSTSRKQNTFPQDRDQIIYKSIDSGRTFFFLGVAIASEGGGGEDKEWMTCDLVTSNSTFNNLMMTSTNTVNGIIRFAQSSDDGITWTTPVNVSDAAGGTGSNLAAGTDGVIHVVWSQGGVRYDRSTDAGASFGIDVQIRSATLNGFPFICVDYSTGITRGNVYVVWSDNSSGSYDVWFQRSTNSGTSWLGTPIRVNDVITNSQWWPAIQCDTNGYLSVVYYDNRTGAGIWNSYFSYSTDAGTTWTNERLSDTSFFGSQPNSDVRFGDYIGIDAFAGTIVPVWTDDRAGSFNQEIYTGLVSIVLSSSDQAFETPRGFNLEQNYPNPFNPSTTISFLIPHSSLVIVTVYNLLGQEVATLVNEVKQAGRHEVVWDARLRPSDSGGQAGALPSGVYFYRLWSDSFTETKKLILLR